MGFDESSKAQNEWKQAEQENNNIGNAHYQRIYSKSDAWIFLDHINRAVANTLRHKNSKL